MQVSLNDILLEILTVANYRKDKEAFVKEFDAYNRLEAMTAVYKTLSPQTQALILQHNNNPQALAQIIPQDSYIKTFTQISKREVRNFIQEINPTLNQAQRQKLEPFAQLVQ